ncbi:MAG: hypothetical protein EBU90_06015 [Proteobacteria bacterium]|nr:hypothetical protein [Pseudomonadota bacterium]NBP13985.1 hypothetical protein [bacterium]
MEEKEFSVNDLIKELNISTKASKDLAEKQDPTITRANLEDFVLNSTGKLVTQGLEIVEGVKDYVMNNPESREVEALSEALKAVASALSVIKDIHVTQVKMEGTKELKIMDIQSRKALKEVDRQEKILMSRDEIFKKILEEANVIEAEATKAINITLPALSAK